MGMTSKEKSRRYRERLKNDPVKLLERQRKKKESYHKNKIMSADRNPIEQAACREIWKLRKQRERKRKKELEKITTNTPPATPPIPDDAPMNLNPDSAAERGRKRLRRDRSKIYRQNLKLKEINEKLKRQCEKYKKRAQRKELKNKKKTHTTEDKSTYNSLKTAIKDRYKRIHNNKEKRKFKEIFNKLPQSEKKELLGLEANVRARKERHGGLTKLKQQIYNFFLRDDISRNTAGKKETIGRGDNKVQKRFLLDSMKNLYKLFKAEYPEAKCTYYYFTRNKPKHVVKPTVAGREMCLCKTHTNVAYKAQALRMKRVTDTGDTNSHILQTVCDHNNMNCMFGSCKGCKDKKIKLNLSEIQGEITWYEWVREEEEYIKEVNKSKDKKTDNNKETVKKKAIKNVKKIKKDSVKNLIETYEKDLKVLKKHVFNMKNQYKCFRKSVDHIQINEAVIVADFSENYNAKCNEEIQGHHFGGSRQQVTLHTVVVYVKSYNNHKALSFCTVSSCNIHQPAAIWGHLHPVLNSIRLEYPTIDTIHFFSDGPFSQYRQKLNFYLACTKFFDYGFNSFTWSFFEAGHGKGPADGIGGYLKRTADNIVATGTDITNALEFYHALEGASKVKLFLVHKTEIDSIQNQLPENIVPLVGTLQVHQVFSHERGKLKYRNLSCFCKRGVCECFEPKNYYPVPIEKTKPSEINTYSEISSDDDIPISHLVNRTPPVIEENHSLLDDAPSNKVLMSIQNLSLPTKKSVYKYVYGSSDSSDDEFSKENHPINETPGGDLNVIEQPKAFVADTDFIHDQPSVSGNLNHNLPRRGDYLLVKVHGAKGNAYTYACVAHSDIEDDGEIKVTFLKAVKGGKLFILNEKDISYISFDDIIKKLPNPDAMFKRGEVYYKFPCSVDIFEK